MIEDIKKWLESRQRIREFLLYCIIGCSGVFLDFLIFTILCTGFEWHYQLANAIGVTCGICNNFFLNAIFNFKRTDRLFLRFLSFYGVGLTGLAISAALLWLFIDRFSFPVIISKLMIIFIVTLVQFTLNKLITFKEAGGK